jgi:MoaA/NifB/PqqE/SkfB family radical SAM enzyme
MSLESFKRIIDEIREYATYLIVGGYGEPFLNRDLIGMLRYAVEAGLYVHLHSNTTLINTPEKVRGLVESGLHFLTTSIDGASQDVYETYRVKGKLNEALEALRNIVAEKRRLKSSRPEIRWQVVVTKQNERQLEEIRRLATEIGVDHFLAKTANLSLLRPQGTADIANELLHRFFPETKAFRRYAVEGRNDYRNACASLYKTAVIFWNGDVTACCFDHSGLNAMGNIFESGSLMAVWNGPAYRALRQKVNTDIRQAKPLCYICPERIRIQPERLTQS